MISYKLGNNQDEYILHDFYDDKEVIGLVTGEDLAKRIVSSYNACIDISVEDLDTGKLEVMKVRYQLS